MTIGYTDLQNYSDIASAIRSKNGSQVNYTPAQMAPAIRAIPTGGGGGGTINWGTITGIRCNVLSGTSSVDLRGLDVSTFTRMSSMFAQTADMANAYYLTGVNVDGWDTSNVTLMNSMFYACKGLTSLDLSCFDTSSVTNMSAMFQMCSALESVNLSGFDTSSATNMNNMFRGCNSLVAIIWSQLPTVQQIPADAASGLYIPAGATVYVPDDLVASYKVATNWSTIASQIDSINNLPQTYKTLYGIE